MSRTEVIVLDNASRDGTAASLRQRFPEIRVIESDRNLGTGPGFNAAMREARGDLILRMEPDAYVVDAVIQRMAQFMWASPDVGMLGCELRFPDGSHQHTAHRQMTVRLSVLERFWLYKLLPKGRRARALLDGYWPAEEAVEADWLAGVTMVRRDVFERTGGMDERFVLGGEESEWARRIQGSGYRVLYQPSLGVIYHVGSAAWNQVWTDRGRLRRWHRVGIDSYAAQHGRGAATGYRLLETLGVLFRAVAYTTLSPFSANPYYATRARDYRMLLGFYLHLDELPGDRRSPTTSSSTDRVDRLDLSLFDEIPPGGMSFADRRSLLALHAALANRGEFSYLEVGSFLGASLQSFIADPRCRTIVSIDRRDQVSDDERSELPEYPGNTTAHMLDRLANVPGADLNKLTTFDADTDQLDPAELRGDLCFIDAEHTDAAVLRDAQFCRRVTGDRGVIAFHDRTLVDRGIRRFLRELPQCRAYPLSHELLVVELNVPSLLSDSGVRAQVPRKVWILAYRLGLMRLALSLASLARRAEAAYGHIALTLAAPRRSTPTGDSHSSHAEMPFEIYTFVNDDKLYDRMRRSFIDAGFDRDGFVRLTDDDDDPYRAITRIGRESTARYPILCHQDVRVDLGLGAVELSAALEELEALDRGWVVAGVAGVLRSGKGLRRVSDFGGAPTIEPGESLPVPVVTLDECFLVFNGRNPPRCSDGISGFHLYGSDVCLHALTSGGAGYVIDFPVTHVGRGNATKASAASFEAVKNRFSEIWCKHFLFCYLVTPSTALFMSRSKILRRVFGSMLAMSCVGQAVRHGEMQKRRRRGAHSFQHGVLSAWRA